MSAVNLLVIKIIFLTDLSSELYRKDLCIGVYDSLKCQPSVNTNFTVFIVELIYGTSTIQPKHQFYLH